MREPTWINGLRVSVIEIERVSAREPRVPEQHNSGHQFWWPLFSSGARSVLYSRHRRARWIAGLCQAASAAGPKKKSPEEA